MAAPCAVQPEPLAALRRDVPGGDQRASPPVDLHPKAAAGPGDGRDMDRRHRAARELSADQHVVRRGDLHQPLGVGLVPVPGLGRDQARHPREVARDESQGVDGVPVGDGQGVRAEAGIALPGAAGGALQRAIPHRGSMTGQHLTHIAGLDLLLHVQQGGANPRLQADRGLHTLGPGKRGQRFGFGGGPAQRPLGVDRLAGFDGGPGRLICKGIRTTTATASISGEATIARKSWKASFAPNAWRASSALSGLVVQTAVNSTSGLASSAGKCDWEAQFERTLAPTNPKRILCAMTHAPQRGDVLHDARDRACRYSAGPNRTA